MHPSTKEKLFNEALNYYKRDLLCPPTTLNMYCDKIHASFYVRNKLRLSSCCFGIVIFVGLCLIYRYGCLLSI